ncbi:MAG: sensor histidine kinase N-terminal domain-containing protein [Rhodospirillales bacterium]|nr:sensor histidine kinase N-terminal domain-containing protein [Rhodospirillales bacterium]
MIRPYSIQRRIMISAAVVLIGVGALTTTIIRRQAVQAADEAYDRVLGAAALSIAGTIGLQDSTVSIDIPHSALAILGTSQLNRIFYRVVSPEGNHVTGSPILSIEIPLTQNDAITFHDSMFRETPIRVARVARYHEGARGGGWVNVFVGETREARDLLSRQLTLQAFLPTATISVLAFLLLYLGVRRSFIPLRAIETSIRSRSPSDLAPITGDVPAEVQTLIFSINDFMERLDSTLAGLRRVTADAAHQLRTPLAAIRALAELTLDDAKHEGPLRQKLIRIRDNSTAAATLANQLLIEATVLHRLESGERERIDFAALTMTTVRQVVGDNKFRMTLPAITTRLDRVRNKMLFGDRIALTEMIRTVLENALKHGAGPIDIALAEGEACLKLSIADRGPGIPKEIEHTVFDRFVKGPSSTSGSGLGLAIARNVAESCGGRICLASRDGGGLIVEFTLPTVTDVQKRHPFGRALMFFALACLSSGMFLDDTAVADERTEVFRIVGTVPGDRLAPLISTIEERFPDTKVAYQSLYESQILSLVSAESPERSNADLVILPSPDLGVLLANEGYLWQFPNIETMPPLEGGEIKHWRHEVFGFFYDPAVFLVRRSALSEAEIPRSRMDLVRMLERDTNRFQKRVGLVNIGIDSVGYALAAQDVMRSPLFWRVARAFGASRVRIYDNHQELISALKDNKIDVAYNVPLSEAVAQRFLNSTIEVVFPNDFVISLPWIIATPRFSSHIAMARDVVALLLQEVADGHYPPKSGAFESAGPHLQNFQRINIGPELLAYLDPLKKTALLDNWLGMIVN